MKITNIPNNYNHHKQQSRRAGTTTECFWFSCWLKIFINLYYCEESGDFEMIIANSLFDFFWHDSDYNDYFFAVYPLKKMLCVLGFESQNT